MQYKTLCDMTKEDYVTRLEAVQNVIPIETFTFKRYEFDGKILILH